MLTTLAITSALLSAAFWALASIAIGRSLASGVISPAAATLFKNSAAAFTFLLCALIFGGHWPVGDAWGWLLVSGFLGFTVSDTLYFAAFQRCGVQTAATVMLLNVPIATVLALPLAGDEIVEGAIPFMLVVVVGVLLVILDARVTKPDPSEGTPSARTSSYWLGILFAVVAAFAIGTAVPLGRGGFDGVGVFIGAFIRLAGGALGAIPIALVAGLRRGATAGGEVSRLIEPVFAAPGPGSVWGRASVIGVGCAVVGLFPYHYAQRELPSGIATTLFATTPLFTLLLAIVLGGRVGWKGWLGTLVGFFGVLGIVSQGDGGPVQTRPVLGLGPEVSFPAQDAFSQRQGARRPSFLKARPRLRAPGGDSHGQALMPPFIAIARPLPGPAVGSSDAGALQVAAGPVLFGGTLSPLPLPRPLLSDATKPLFARGHWADLPFACRLTSGGLLVGTPQPIGGDELGYGLRLGLEVDGPPALDLGWIHRDQSDVLHGFGQALPLRTGGAEVIWVDDRDGDQVPSMALYRRQVDALGVLGEETKLDGSICDCCPPDLVELPDGSLVVAYRHRSTDNIRDIFLSRRDPRDAAWSIPTAVHEDGWKLDGCPVNGPAVAATADVLAVAWFTQAGASGTREIRVAFSSDGGRTFGEPYSVVAQDTNGRVAIVAAAATPEDDRFLLVHLAQNHDAEASGLESSWRAGLVRPDGAVSDFALVAEVDGSRSSGRLDLVLAAPGTVQAVWAGPEGLVSAQLHCGKPGQLSPAASQGARAEK